MQIVISSDATVGIANEVHLNFKTQFPKHCPSQLVRVRIGGQCHQVSTEDSLIGLPLFQ